MTKALVTVLLTLAAQPLSAVSLDRMQVAPKKSFVIATVDLERVFRAYPETKRAKEELEKLILFKENEIAAKRAEIFRLTAEMKQSATAAPPAPPTPPPATEQPPTTAVLPDATTTTIALPGFEVTPSTPPISPPAVEQPPSQATNFEGKLTTLKQELARLERQAERNLEDLEEAKTKTLLAKIYATLKELSQEKGVDMLVDKNAILWGAPELDLTDDLLKKLKIKTIERE